MPRPSFVFEPAINSRDHKTRPAVRLHLNDTPTQLFAYSRERARAMVQRARRVGDIDLLTLNQVVGEINRLRQLPEVCPDFPYLCVCQCTQHAALIDADGEDFYHHPAYSQAVLLARLQADVVVGNIFARDVPRLQAAIQRSGLPREVQAEDHLAERMGAAITLQATAQARGRPHVLDQRSFNWCDIHSMAGKAIRVNLEFQDEDTHN